VSCDCLTDKFVRVTAPMRNLLGGLRLTMGLLPHPVIIRTKQTGRLRPARLARVVAMYGLYALLQCIDCTTNIYVLINFIYEKFT
jgi:hypothetical protein